MFGCLSKLKTSFAFQRRKKETKAEGGKLYHCEYILYLEHTTLCGKMIELCGKMIDI